MRVNASIVGTQKGGTTALAKFLAAHPQVCSPKEKEVHFFDFEHKYNAPEGYESWFPSYSGQPIVLDSTPIYMYLPFIAERMRAYNPEFKLIFILRDPADRAYSHYQMEKERGIEKLPFSLALRLEDRRLQNKDLSTGATPWRCYSYVDRGFYFRQIENMLSVFPREQMLFLRNEELSQAHNETLRKVYRFLEIDEVEPPSSERVFTQTYRPMHPLDRQFILQKVAADVNRLANLTGWDLGAWTH